MMKNIREYLTCLLAAATVGVLTSHSKGNDLDARFGQPTEETKPWCYWYWLGGDITAEGITNDLESMHTVGIKRAFIASIGGGSKKGRPHVEILTDEWIELFRYALREAKRLGIEISMFNSPGWSMSGGPWIKPEQSMRHVIWTETPAEGGNFSQLVRPESKFPVQDIAVMAIPRREFRSMTARPDGKVLLFNSATPVTVRSLTIEVEAKYSFAGTLSGTLPDGSRKELLRVERPFNARSKCDTQPTAPEIYSVEETTAREFTLTLEGEVKGLKSATLSAEPLVAQPYEKQLARLHAREFPDWKQHAYPASVEPGNPLLALQLEEIHLIKQKPDAGGRLTCTLPEGSWTVLCFGMTSTGKTNLPAPPEATGLECDKLSKSATRHHLKSMFEPIFARLTPDERSVIKSLVADSYEAGTQNWTDGFDRILQDRNGYDPIPYLPTFTGRVVKSAAASDRFLWDLRRTVADQISENYVATLNEVGDELGLDVWMENYGSWGFPGDALYYGKHADMVSGEFWLGRPMGIQMCRIASSTAHIYGKPRVFAESYTSFIKPFHHPYVMKRRGEELFTHGVNHAVLHVVVHQPQEGAPGRNPWFGVQLHRNTPWFLSARSWVKYHQRMHTMLQEGRPSADIAIYVGDFAPQTVGPENPVPWGYDFDYINSDIILNHLEYKDGKWVVNRPGASSYRAIVLPETGYVRPQVAARVRELRRSGGPILGSVPVTDAQLVAAGIRPVVSDANQDCRWKMRELDEGAIFLLCNFEKTGAFEATLRHQGMVPELFDPVTGAIHKLATYQSVDGGTRVRFQVNDLADSRFIVFRHKSSGPSVAEVNGEVDLWFDGQSQLVADTRVPGNYTATLSDGGTRTVTIAIGSAVIELKPAGQPNAMGHQQYSASFNHPQDIPDGARIQLDLGEVSIMSGGTLNGQPLETRWMPPFSWEVTDILKAGTNELRITATALNLETTGEIKGPAVLKWTTQEWR